MLTTKKIIALVMLLIAAVYAFIQHSYLLLLLIGALMVYVWLRNHFAKTLAIAQNLVYFLFKKFPAAYLVDDANALTVEVSQNRRLVYNEYGSPDGMPVFYFHGSPSSRMEALLVSEERYKAQDLRIIAINRPGIGLSDGVKVRHLEDWPNDVAEVADKLGIAKFAVLGFSGGAPYVAACAAKFADRLTAAVIVSGAWKMYYPEALQDVWERVRLLWKTAKIFPLILPKILRSMRSGPQFDQQQAREQHKKSMVEQDFEAVEKHNLYFLLRQIGNEAVYNLKGAAADVRMNVNKWRLDTSNILYPIAIFHGAKDRNVSLALACKMHEELAGSSLTVFEDEAHVSTFINEFDTIAATLKMGS